MDTNISMMMKDIEHTIDINTNITNGYLPYAEMIELFLLLDELSDIEHIAEFKRLCHKILSKKRNMAKIQKIVSPIRYIKGDL